MNQRFMVVQLCFLALFSNNPTVHGTPSQDDDLNTKMLEWHNEVRTKVRECKLPGQPQAASMPNLTYNQELAEKAQNWANQCKVGHDNDTDRNTTKWGTFVGQNWAGSSDFKRGFDLWFGEHVNYTLDDNTCKKGSTCGHYTQIVWAQTESVGCAFKECDKPFLYGKSIVCNYGPSGNVQHQKPYEKGAHAVCPPPSTITTTTSKATTTNTDPTVNLNPTSAPSTENPTKPIVTSGVTTDQPVSPDSTESDATDLTTETTSASRSLTSADWLLCTTMVCWIAAFFCRE